MGEMEPRLKGRHFYLYDLLFQLHLGYLNLLCEELQDEVTQEAKEALERRQYVMQKNLVKVGSEIAKSPLIQIARSSPINGIVLKKINNNLSAPK